MNFFPPIRMSRGNIEHILEQEVGKVFCQVLEDAGVYKCTPKDLRPFTVLSVYCKKRNMGGPAWPPMFFVRSPLQASSILA